MEWNETYWNRTYSDSGYSLVETVSIVFVSSLITLLAIPSNAIVIYIIARIQSMRTTTNYLLLNLCIADLLTVLNLPFVTVDLYITESWIFGSFVCRLVSFSKSIGTKASILILMALSIERYLTICRPNRVVITPRQVHLACIIVWLIAAAVAMPLFIFKDVFEEDQGFVYCVETWPLSHAAVYTCILFALFYLVPVVLMTALYVKIAQKLWRSTKRTNSMRRTSSNSSSNAAAKSRLTKICVVIVSSFAISWAPTHVVTLIYYFADMPHGSHDLNMIVYPIIQGISFSNCALNPFLYCFMSQNFRNAMLSEWKRLTTRRQQRLYSGLPGVYMRSRTTSMRFQGSQTPSKEAANESNVCCSSNTSVTVFESAL